MKRKFMKLLALPMLAIVALISLVGCSLFMVEKVELSETAITLSVGETATLTATVLPAEVVDKTVVWSSENEEIATVENGVVTAVAEGEVNVIAECQGMKGVCVVTVESAPPYEDTLDKWDGATSTDEDIDNIYNAETKTYVISTASELAWIAAKTNTTDNAVRTTFAGVTFELAQDINLNNEPWDPIGSYNGTMASYPSYTFAGVFDGKGHTIYNLNVTATGEYATAGLFGSTVNGTIKNLTISGATVTSDHWAAGIVAYTSNGVTLENCKVVNSVIHSEPMWLEASSKYDNGDKVGGLAGYLAGTVSITGCTVEDTQITGYRHIGGLVGYLSGTFTVENNTVKDVVLTQDDKNGYKDEAAVAVLVSEFIGNAAEGVTVGENTKEKVEIVNVEVTETAPENGTDDGKVEGK